MKTQVIITYETKTINDSDSILTQIGLLLIKNANANKINDFEIQHKEIK